MRPGVFVAASLALALSGCAGIVAHQQGIDLFAQGKQEEGLAKLAQAAREAPHNQVYLVAWRNALARMTGRLLADARVERNEGRYDAAEAKYRHVLRLDPNSAEAAAELASLALARVHAASLKEAQALLADKKFANAQARIETVLREEPRHPQARVLLQTLLAERERELGERTSLGEAFRKPVTLEFRDASLRQVLEALSTHSGLNFILDREVPPNLTVTVFLRRVSVAEALDLILTTRQLRSRVLNDSSLLVYPDTAAKLAEHQELMVRNFFLANSEARNVLNMLKTVLRAKSVFADDKLNLIVMRDTPEMVALAERLVATQDVAEPEVMLELAVMEVTRSRLNSLGLVLPSQLTLAPIPQTGTTLTLTDLKNLNSDRLGATISPTVINLQDDSSGENLLANPRIRTHSREKAVIRIGDRVPVITTTATSTGFVSENVQYLDVGLKLEVEPVVYPDDEIVIKLGLEVSNVVGQITSRSGTVAYQVGGRNAATVLRLKDGETQILGGLINDDDIRSANRFPGLSSLPVLGRLFSNETRNNQKRELVLTVTPRIVRSLLPPSGVPARFWSGTETGPGVLPAVRIVPEPGIKAPVLTAPAGGTGGSSTPEAPPGAAGAVPAAPALQPDQTPPGGAGAGEPAATAPVAPTQAPSPAPQPGAASGPGTEAPAEGASEPIGTVAPQFGPAMAAPEGSAPMTTTPIPAPPLEPPPQ